MSQLNSQEEYLIQAALDRVMKHVRDLVDRETVKDEHMHGTVFGQLQYIGSSLSGLAAAYRDYQTTIKVCNEHAENRKEEEG